MPQFLSSFLVVQRGKCEECGAEFGTSETLQSTNVECNNCNKKKVVCRKCKIKGCECGGKLLDSWDKNPGMIF